MIETNFDRRIFTPEKLAVWFTFWSDAQLRGRYRAAATRVERRYIKAIEVEVAALLHGSRSAADIARPLMAMIDGFWLQSLLYQGDLCGARPSRPASPSSTRGWRAPAGACRGAASRLASRLRPDLPRSRTLGAIPCAAISPMTPKRSGRRIATISSTPGSIWAPPRPASP